jgi:uncharacterized repeat protein (TIGR03803 family)
LTGRRIFPGVNMKTGRGNSKTLIPVLLCVALISRPAQAQTYTVIHRFAGFGASPPDGASPNGDLIRDVAGNLYGTTSAGGSGGGNVNQGTIFKVGPTGMVTVLYSFTAGTDGRFPYAGLLRGADGSLYGTTNTGGDGGGGTVFRLDTTNTLTTLHSFVTEGSDGDGPPSRLVSINGDLYGVAEFGGVSSCLCGVIFKMTKSGTETVLHSFTGGADGAYPQSLIRDSAGNLYGVTAAAGSNLGAGTVFKLDTAGVFTMLYTFTGGADGGVPRGRLIRDNTKGTLRGATAAGGDSSCNCGVVFELDSSGHETVIHKFLGHHGGATPSVGLLDVAGTLYGTTIEGGDLNCGGGFGCGVLYQIGKTGQYTVLHRFAGAPAGDGRENNRGGLTLGTDGSIYGVTTYGGGTTTCKDCGIIFKYTP